MPYSIIYSHVGLTSKQIGLTGQLISDLKAAGHDLKVILCDNVLHNCYFNRSHNLIGCAACQSRFGVVLDANEIKSEDRWYLKPLVGEYKFPEIQSTEELIDIEYKGINIGRGVASSIISYKRDFHLSSKKYGELIAMELSKSVNIVENWKIYLSKWTPDHVYVFNGRFSEVHPVLELCKAHEIPFSTFEAGSGTNYELFEGGLPHSITIRNERMNSLWNDADPDAREQIAHNWFRKKRKGDESLEFSFTKNQISDLAPNGFDSNQRNILLLNSSEDEIKSIQEWNTDLYPDQNTAIVRLVEAFKGDPEFTFYLRVHPNLGKVANAQMDQIRQFDFPNLVVIDPLDPIHTYHMIDICEKSIAFGSTSGIEATYWGKPSILFGNSFYKYQDCVYNPKSFADLQMLIRTKELPAMPQASCLPYAYYMSTYGRESGDFEFEGLKEASFKGKRIRRFPLTALQKLIRYRSNLPLWKKMHRAFFQDTLRLKNLLKYK